MTTPSRPPHTQFTCQDALHVMAGPYFGIQYDVDHEQRERPDGKPPRWLTIGDEGILWSRRVGPLFVAKTSDAFDAMLDAIQISDDHGFAQLLAKDDLFVVDQEAPVLALDRGLLRTHVRILAGPHEGRAGWVPHEWAIFR